MAVLLYGCRKAGTTLFQRLLDGGEKLFVHPSETKIKYFLRAQKDNADTQYPLRKLGFSSVFPYYFRSAKKGWKEVNNQIYREYISQEYKKIKNLNDFIELDINASIDAMQVKKNDFQDWVIKEVSGNTQLILESFIKAFPKGKIILILRDHRENTNSIYREKIKTGTLLNFSRNRAIANEPYRIFFNLQNFINREQVYPVFYEDVVNSIERVMENVSRFLDIPYSDILTRPTINGTPCKVPSSSKETEKIFFKKKPLSYGIRKDQYLHIMYQSFQNKKLVNKYNNLRSANSSKLL